MKTRILKLLRNVSISIVVLLLLTVGGGAAYTWYMGQDSNEKVAGVATPVASKPVTIIKPAQPTPTATMSASVQMLTSPVIPGSNASITVRANAKSKCTITVEYNKVVSTDSGLVAKVADEYGIVSWSWTVEESVPLGKWPVKVTCANAKHSAVVQGELEVKKQLAQ